MHQMEQEKITVSPSLNAFLEEQKFDLHGFCQFFLQHHSSFLAELNKYVPFHDYSITFN